MPISERLRKRLYACFVGPEVTDETVLSFMDACTALEPYIAGVVVNLCQIPLAVDGLSGAAIRVIGPVAYPLGNLPSELKRVQIQAAIKDHASGIAAIMKIEALRAGDYPSAQQDAQAIAAAAGPGKSVLALIGNSGSLTDTQAVEAARIARTLGAAYVTSPGFGAVSSPAHVRMLREALGDDATIIAAGGCRSAEQALAYLEAGADGIATSTPFEILQPLAMRGSIS